MWSLLLQYKFAIEGRPRSHGSKRSKQTQFESLKDDSLAVDPRHPVPFRSLLLHRAMGQSLLIGRVVEHSRVVDRPLTAAEGPLSRKSLLVNAEQSLTCLCLRRRANSWAVADDWHWRVGVHGLFCPGYAYFAHRDSDFNRNTQHTNKGAAAKTFSDEDVLEERGKTC